MRERNVERKNAQREIIIMPFEIKYTSVMRNRYRLRLIKQYYYFAVGMLKVFRPYVLHSYARVEGTMRNNVRNVTRKRGGKVAGIA